jgi:Tfp pilus assembly protein FimT
MMEVVVTMMIMGVMAGVAVPRIMSNLSDYRAESAANRIASDLRLAQKRARTNGTSETVTFDVVNDRYSFSTIPDPKTNTQIYSVDVSDYPYSATISGVDIGGSQSVTFNGLGFPGASGTLTVTSGQSSWGVSLEAVSGALTVGEE